MTEELCRVKFEAWWEQSFGYKPVEGWENIYVLSHDYFLAEDIDDKYDTWKAAWNSSAEMEKRDD